MAQTPKKVQGDNQEEAQKQGSPEQIRAFGAFIKLCRATWSLTSRVARSLPGEITFAQFAVLEALDTLGPMNQRTISRKILRSSASVNVVVDNLERRGLVKRTRSKIDRRNVEVSLTPTGHELMRDVLPVYVSTVQSEFNVLSEEEQEELGRLCRTLGLQDTVSDPG
ncbi:MAG: MarR family transcriptional regulator [Actinobacteria bacterium]|nr:MarR family transcriptional regulator [Actinomycetota bacterium]